MKISVIVPCYNAERYLEDCLRSVLGQTEQDFEVIAVDDGSTDGTANILSRLSAEDARLQVIRQPNRGVSAARNRAMERAKGEWLFFLDADDLLPQMAFETLLEHAGDAVDLIVGMHTTFDPAREIREEPEGCWMRLHGEAQRESAARRLIEGDAILNIMCNKLHRASLLRANGIRLQEAVCVAEDALFNLEAVLLGRGIAYVPAVTYRYRMHGASAMHSQSATNYEMHLPWLCAMRDLLLRTGMMGRYYAAYLDTVILRLYKDGGIPEVLRGWRDRIVPLVQWQPRPNGMSLGSRLTWRLVQSGIYPILYPSICIFEVARRRVAHWTRRMPGGECL